MPEADRYQARLAAGLCVTCGSNAPAPGHTACPDCLAARRAHQAATAAARRRSGTCLDCGTHPAAPGLYRCRPCADRQSARMRNPTPRPPSA